MKWPLRWPRCCLQQNKEPKPRWSRIHKLREPTPRIQPLAFYWLKPEMARSLYYVSKPCHFTLHRCFAPCNLLLTICQGNAKSNVWNSGPGRSSAGFFFLFLFFFGSKEGPQANQRPLSPSFATRRKNIKTSFSSSFQWSRCEQQSVRSTETTETPSPVQGGRLDCLGSDLFSNCNSEIILCVLLLQITGSMYYYCCITVYLVPGNRALFQ